MEVEAAAEEELKQGTALADAKQEHEVKLAELEKSLSGCEGELAASNTQLGALKVGCPGDGVALAEAQGKVTDLEAKLGIAEDQVADVNPPLGVEV